jgi:adenylate kinase family enzyme
MKEIPCIVIVGKPGAGKSSIGSALAKLLSGHYISLGGFMRETLHLPDPHIGIDKNPVYRALLSHYAELDASKTLVFDCHPYPESDFQALQSFLEDPALRLQSVVHVEAQDSVALDRLKRRPRPGQSYADRLKYYNDHQHLITKLLEHPTAIQIENNIDFENSVAIENIAREIITRLQNQKL